MFNWKVVVTAIVVLVIIAIYLGSNPAVSSFMESLGNKLSFNVDMRNRDVEFSLETMDYPDIDFSTKNPMNITITGSIDAVLKTGSLKTQKIEIYDFRGSGSVYGNILKLDGKFSKIMLAEINTALAETVKLNSTFTSLQMNGLTVNDMKIQRTSGSLTARESTTNFVGDIELSSPEGNFDFSDKFSLSGKAARIVIPANGISID